MSIPVSCQYTTSYLRSYREFRRNTIYQGLIMRSKQQKMTQIGPRGVIFALLLTKSRVDNAIRSWISASDTSLSPECSVKVYFDVGEGYIEWVSLAVFLEVEGPSGNILATSITWKKPWLSKSAIHLEMVQRHSTWFFFHVGIRDCSTVSTTWPWSVWNRPVI